MTTDAIRTGGSAGRRAGQFALSCWTADVEGLGTHAFALLADVSRYEGESLMPSVARALGLDPTPGSLTPAIRADTRFRFTDDATVHLMIPRGNSLDYAPSIEWRNACRHHRYAHLYVSYLRYDTTAVIKEHLREMSATNSFSSALIPLV